MSDLPGPPPIGATLGGRFTLTRVLGRGAQSTVFLARDLLWQPPESSFDLDTVSAVARADGRHHPPVGRYVALKVLTVRRRSGGPRVLRATAVLRHRHELLATSQVAHPSVIRLVSAGVDGPHLYLALEYAPGPSLERLIRLRRPVAPLDAARWAKELADGLAIAHQIGVVHRDIKPANIVLVDEQHPKLVDFGLARPGGLHADVDRGLVVGTLSYLAPEAWDEGARPDGRSDLYGLAATFYELLSGRCPFPGVNRREVLARHRAGPPRDLTRLNPDVPPLLAEVLERALEPDPDRRYCTAEGLAADLQEVGRTAGRVPFRLGRADVATRRASVGAVLGREAEREQVLAAVRRAAGGQGGLVVVESEAGGGRSAFVASLRDGVEDRAGRLLVGRAPPRAGSELPLEPLVACLAHFRALVGRRAPLPDAEARLASLRRAMQGRWPELLELVPTLVDLVPEGEPRPPLDDPGGERRRAALVAALLATGCFGRPSVLVLDDLEQADPSTHDAVRALVDLLPGSHLVLVLTLRQGDEAAAARARALLSRAGGLHLRLPPLTTEDTARLLAAALRLDRGAADVPAPWARELSGGNPRRILAIARRLEEVGALRAGPSGLTVDLGRAQAVRLPGETEARLRGAVDGLPAGVRSVLGAVTRLGPAPRLVHILRTLDRMGRGSSEVLAALHHLRDAGLLLPDPDERTPGLRPAHTCVRDAVRDEWPGEAREALHEAAALVLTEGLPAAELEDVALFEAAAHAVASRRPEPVRGLLLHAGRRALERGDPRRAESLFRAVRRRSQEPGLRSAAQLSEADAALRAGRPERAVGLMDRLLAEEQPAEVRARALLVRADGAGVAGRLDEASRDVCEALATLGRPLPASRLGVRAVRLVETARLGRARPLQDPRLRRRQRLLAEAHRLATTLLFPHRPDRALLASLRAARAAARAGLGPAELRTVAVPLLLRGMLVGDTRLARRTLAVAARSLGSTDPRAALYFGLASLLSGDAGDAAPLLQHAADGLEQRGDRRHLRSALGALGLARRAADDVQGATRAFEALHELAGEDGDLPSRGWATLGLAWSRWAQGAPSAALALLPPPGPARPEGDRVFEALVRAWQARFQAAEGSRDRARWQAAEVAEDARGRPLPLLGRVLVRVLAAEACLEAGAPSDVPRLLPDRADAAPFEDLAWLRKGIRALAAMRNARPRRRGRLADVVLTAARKLEALGHRRPAERLRSALHRDVGRPPALGPAALAEARPRDAGETRTEPDGSSVERPVRPA